MDETRREQLYNNRNHETDDPETQEWRDELTAEELEYVDQLDNSYVTGVQRICTAILVRERVRQRLPGPAGRRRHATAGSH